MVHILRVGVVVASADDDVLKLDRNFSPVVGIWLANATRNKTCSAVLLYLRLNRALVEVIRRRVFVADVERDKFPLRVDVLLVV